MFCSFIWFVTVLIFARNSLRMITSSLMMATMRSSSTAPTGNPPAKKANNRQTTKGLPMD